MRIAARITWGVLGLTGALSAAGEAGAQQYSTLPDGTPCREFQIEFDGAPPPGWAPLPPCHEVEVTNGTSRTERAPRGSRPRARSGSSTSMRASSTSMGSAALQAILRHRTGGGAEGTMTERGRSTSMRGSPRTTRRGTRGSRRGTRRGGSDSRSIGLTNDGRLVDGVRVEESERLRYVPSETRGGGRFFATRELAGLIERVAAAMAREYRNVRLSIGELSAAAGGPIPGHRSHQAGRDVDFAFYYKDARNRRVEPDEFVRIGDRGVSRPQRGGRLTFDADANWKLVSHLLSDPHTNVQFIFVAEHLQWMLLDAATRQRTPYELIQRARQSFREPEDHSHDNHFHVRLFCAPDDYPQCRDEGVVWPPYGHRRRERGELARARERAERLGLGTEAAAITAMRRPPPQAWRNAIPGAAPSYLGWPVTKGYFNRGFGFTREDNPDIPHNGIDIGAPPGSIVRASASGLVAFAGEFRSFGNVVFIVHKNGWVTNYAHNERNTVIAGELVQRGQPIGLLGNTGVSRGPHVHYEYRVRGHVRDPEPVMRGIRRWTDEHGPPRRIESSAPVVAQDEGAEGSQGPTRIPVRMPTEEDGGDTEEDGDAGRRRSRFNR